MKKLIFRITELMLSCALLLSLAACGGNTGNEVSDKDELSIAIGEEDADDSADDTTKDEADTSETTDNLSESEEVEETGWAVLEAYLVENGEHYSGEINTSRQGDKYSLSLPMENGDELRFYLCIPEDGDRWINVTFDGYRRDVRHYAEYYVGKNFFHDNCEPNKTCPVDRAIITRDTFYNDFEVYDDEKGEWVKLTDEADINEENEIIMSLFTYFDSFVNEEFGLSMFDFGFYEWNLE